MSTTGTLAFKKNISDEKINFQIINNNINEFLTLSQFKKDKYVSIKDMLISRNNIFVSYTQEIKEDCWNTRSFMEK